MAATLTETKGNSALEIKFKTGEQSKSGKDVSKVLKYSNVKATAASQDIFDVGTAFSSVLVTNVVEISRVDSTHLAMQGA